MRLHAHLIDVVILTPETVGLVWCLTSSLSLSVEFSVTGEAKDVARSAPQGLLSLKRVLEGGSSERQHLVGVERRSRTTEGT